MPRCSGIDAALWSIKTYGDKVEFLTDDVNAALRQLTVQGVNLNGLSVKAPNLDDLFLKLIGHNLASTI